MLINAKFKLPVFCYQSTYKLNLIIILNGFPSSFYVYYLFQHLTTLKILLTYLLKLENNINLHLNILKPETFSSDFSQIYQKNTIFRN